MKVATQHLIWHSDPRLDSDGNVMMKRVTGVVTESPDIVRVNLRTGMTVPDSVPAEVVAEWEAKGWVREDPNAAPPPAVPLPEVAFNPGLVLPKREPRSHKK